MLIQNAQIIKKEGKKEFVVLPYDEFLKIQEQLLDYEDLRCLRKAKETEKDAPAVSLDELKKQIKRGKKQPAANQKGKGRRTL